MTARDYFRHIADELTGILGSTGEGEGAARILFEDIAGYDRKYLFANGDREITDFVAGKIAAAVEAVRNGLPVQYAVGKALFMGMDFKVSPAVLIPRFETEGLVDMVTDRFGGRSDLDVLDICTGSGCIAIAIARALPFAHVQATDISDEALAIARENSRTLGSHVDFRLEDVLKAPAPAPDSLDIVVSNPPYVLHSEAAGMDERVVGHEPAQALFVPDDNPLLFYRAIGAYAATALRKGGAIFFEINSRFPRQVCSLLQDLGFAEAVASRDYKGNWRYVTATWPQ